MEDFKRVISLGDVGKNDLVCLGRGRVISSIDMYKIPGDYPVYSSSSKKEGLFGKFGNFDFDEELITWSVDGGGYFFYRPHHKFSITNVSGVLKILDNSKLDYKFLYYLLDFQHRNQIYDYVDKAHPSIIKKRYFIPEIGIVEQNKIAEILTNIDKAISQTEAIIEKQKKIKTGLIQDLLTNGIDEKGVIRNEKTHQYKDSQLGRIPIEWDCKTIKDISERLRSGVTPKGGSNVYQNEGVMLIRSQNVYSYGFKLNDVAYISDEINSRMLGSQLNENDVLVNITGASIGRATFVTKNFPRANVNQHVCAIRLNETSLSKAIFLSVFLNSIYGQNQIYQNINGSNREGINYTQIKDIKFPFFNSDTELERFTELILKINKEIKNEEIKLSKLKSIKTGLMQDLLSGKKRVTHLIN